MTTGAQTGTTDSARHHPRRYSFLDGELDASAAAWGLASVSVVLVGVYFGSGGMRWFDAALSGYLLGVLLSTFAVVYRYKVWLARPPTALLNRRGWQALNRRGRRARNAAALGGLVATNLAGQGFIRRRSTSRSGSGRRALSPDYSREEWRDVVDSCEIKESEGRRPEAYS